MFVLDYICQIRGLEHKDIAAIADVHPATVQDWFKGRRRIPPRRADMLEEELQFSSTRFLSEISLDDKIKILNTEQRRILQEAL